MDQEKNNEAESQTDSPSKPAIPPPDLSRRAPPPPSPMEGIYKSPPASAGNAAAKVNLRGVLSGDELESPANPTALFNTRMTAAAIDILVSMGITIGLILILPGFAARLGWLAGLAYLVTRDSLPFLGGQSVGKKAMKIKVVTLDGQSLVGNWEAAVIRNGVLIIPLFGLVELFILLSREDKADRGRRLGDEWAKTRVIHEPKPPVAPEEAG